MPTYSEKTPRDTMMAMKKSNPVYRLTSGLARGTLVEITDWNDGGDFWYIGFRAIQYLEDKVFPQEHDSGRFEAIRVYKNMPKPERTTLRCFDAPHLGVGARCAYHGFDY